MFFKGLSQAIYEAYYEAANRDRDNEEHAPLRMWTGPYVRPNNKIICSDHLPAVELQEAEDERRYHVGKEYQILGMVPYPGVNRISDDFSGGRETIPIPLYNDIDQEPAPVLEKYVLVSERNGEPVEHWHQPAGVQEKRNPSCNNCQGSDAHTAEDPVSHHLARAVVKPNTICGRWTDQRQDWQGVPMFGRLCYDNFGIMQLPRKFTDLQSILGYT